MAGTTRQRVLLAITQPLTATQLSRKLGMSTERCSNALAGLRSQKLVRCLNPSGRRSRLFWLTTLGQRSQNTLARERCGAHDFPNVDWGLYASVCFSHRSEVVRTLTHAMQPSEIKRRSAFRTPGLRMSANNVRDVICYLKACGIVRLVTLKKKRHAGYELTEIGLQMRRLIMQAEVRSPEPGTTGSGTPGLSQRLYHRSLAVTDAQSGSGWKEAKGIGKEGK